MYRTVLIHLANPHEHKEDSERNLVELQSLITTYGAIDIIHIIQHRTQPDKATFIGSGKVKELIEIVSKKRIDLIVINDMANPSQLFHLTQFMWKANADIKVWDRVDLILHIFEKHAHTAEAKLQIEIARMQHMGPRMYGLGGTYFSRQGAGIGTKGLGETNIELMKRHWRNQIKKKREEIERLSNQHMLQVTRRKENDIQNVSIVGYTNAGKTSLFNMMTKKHQIVKNALFVTLDSITGKLYFPLQKKEITVSDTIGFIKNLPASLIQSFESTLMESIHADILLHVVDISDPEMKQKIEIVEGILQNLQVHPKKIIYVFNKIDAFVGDGETILKEIRNTYSLYDPHFISVKTNYGIEKLKNKLEIELFNHTPQS